MDERTPTVLQVLPALNSGGVERGTLDVARALVEHDWRAVVASAGGRLVPILNESGANHVTLPLDTKTPWGIARNRQRLTGLCRREQVTLIHARSRAPAWSAWKAARDLGLPFVTTYHGTYGMGGPGKRFYNGIMARGDAVIAISGFIRDYILTHHPKTDPERITVIPRGIDLKLFNPNAVTPAGVQQLRRDWHLPVNRRIILVPSRPSRWKGLDVTLHALAALRDMPDWHAVFSGCTGNRYAGELKKQAARLGLDGRVTFAPPTLDMAAAYFLAEVVLSPATKPEAFGRVAVEAQAMGRLVVATDHGGSRETVQQGQTGWLVTPGDAGALAGAVREALMLPESFAHARRVAARLHARTFSLEKMLDSTLSLYRQVLLQHRMKRI